MKLNIIILYGGDFPTSTAYANRMIAFAKGFQKNGHKLNFLIIYPGRKSDNTNPFNNEFEGIKCKTTHRIGYPDNAFKKVLYSVISGYYMLKEIIILNKNSKINCILSCSDNFIMMLPLFLWTRINKIMLLREYNEFPAPELGIKKKYYIITHLFYRFRFNLFDGMVLISSALVSYFSNILNKNKRIIKIPIIVEPERFCCQDQDKRRNIVFIGDILGDKDGTTILIDAFIKIASKIIDQNLVLIGDISFNDKRYVALYEKIRNAKLQKRIHFVGQVSREQVNLWLCKARILALARPANKQSIAGFPTKLGEYLATGNPVVCTKVGDIPIYLHDGVNAFLAEPGDIDSFANKLLLAYNDPIRASEIGNAGKMLVQKVFNYMYQSNRLEEFISEFKC